MINNISLKQLRAFVAVAEHASFAEASQALNLTQPALSVSIKNLEDVLGGELISRTTRSHRLTPEGKQLLQLAKGLLQELDVGLNEVSQLFRLQQGQLQLAAMPSFASTLLPAVLANYQQRYPNVSVTVRDIVMEDVISAVSQGRVSLGITFEADNLLDLQFSTLCDDHFVAIFPHSHPLAQITELSITDLLRYPFVTLNRGSSTRRWIDALFDEHGQPPRVLETMNLTTVGAMVTNGVGVSLVPAICATQMQQLGARVQQPSDHTISKRIGYYQRRQEPLSSNAHAFLALLRSAFVDAKGIPAQNH